MSHPGRGFALLEALGAALLLAILGLMAASHATAQIEVLARERALVHARTLAHGLDWQLRRSFARAGTGATSVAWHFEGIDATLALPAAGTTSHPAPLPFLAPAAPRWTVFPVGQPRRRADPPGYYREGGGAWIVVDPVGGTPEIDPVAAGWDANENGVVDRPDLLAASLAGEPHERTLAYAITLTAPATPGGSYLVELSIYRTMAFRGAPGDASTVEVRGADRLVQRTLELRPGGGP